MSDWFRARRLDLIDALLATRGELRRSDLTTRFGYTAAIASADIDEFKRTHPGVLNYDGRAKRYRAPPNYRGSRALPAEVRETLNLIAQLAYPP